MDSANFLAMWTEIREDLERICLKYDSVWMKRERKINTKFLVLFLLKLTMPKDERGYSNTLIEIFNKFVDHGIGSSTDHLAASSICAARTKLDPEIFKELNNAVIANWKKYNSTPHLWHGRELYGLDGSKMDVPVELLKDGYKKTGDHCHYPQGLMSSIYDLSTGIPLDFDIVNHGDERACALKHLECIPEGSVVVFDRGYFCYEMLEGFVKQKVDVIFRLAKGTGYKELEDFWNGKETDLIVSLKPSKTYLKALKKRRLNTKLDEIKVRLIKYVIKDTVYVLLTTLTDEEKFPENIFPAVYHSRWGHEELLKVSKVITGVKDFHSLSERGIKQELFAHFFIITLLKIVEHQAHRNVKEEREKKNIEEPKRRLRPLKGKGKKRTDHPESITVEKIALKNQDFKINQKSCFLLIGWGLEKLFWFPLGYLQRSVISMVDFAARVRQNTRPGRQYPRVSKTPHSKWSGRRSSAYA